MTATKEIDTLLKRFDAKENWPRAILIIGQERLRRERITAKIIDKIQHSLKNKSQNSEATIERYNGNNLNSQKLQTVIDSAQSISLFASFKVIVLNELQILKAPQYATLHELLKEQGEGSIFILTASKLPSNNALYKHLYREKLILKFAELKGAELVKWTEHELKLQGFKSFSRKALDALINVAESSPDKICQYTEQLSIYLDSDKLDEDDVFALFAEHANPREFVLIDYILAGKEAKAEALLSELLSGGKNPFLLLNLIARTFSNYQMIQSLAQNGKTQGQIQNELNLSPWVFKQTYRAAFKYPKAKLRKALPLILQADSRLKNRSLGPELICSSLISELAT